MCWPFIQDKYINRINVYQVFHKFRWCSGHAFVSRAKGCWFKSQVSFYILRCTLTKMAVGTIWQAVSKPPQRRQGHGPCPLRLLVVTPAALGPQLAYRLREAQPTLMDVSRYFLIYYYITIHVGVPHFYDLSTLVGCWTPVSIRRIIYNFYGVCPFDYAAFAVSGKV